MEKFSFGHPYSRQYTPSCDSVDEVYCEVCGSLCDVERNVLGATGWAEAMGKHKHFHDRFICPVNETETDSGPHGQIYRLREEIKKCPSPSVRKLMENDLQEMLQQIRTAVKGKS